MSYIAFHTKGREEVKVWGSERAHMQLLMADIAAAVLPRGLGSVHPFVNIIPVRDQDRWVPQLTEGRHAMWIPIYLSAHSDTKLHFNGEDHETFETVINTILAMNSDIMSFMAKVWGNCESHGWFPPEDHMFFASIINEGLDRHILRSGKGWDQVLEMFSAGLEDPIVMSYSVTDGFPNAALAGHDYEEDEEWWLNTSAEEQWDVCVAALKEKPYEDISSDTLNGRWFLDAATLWDAVESPEWRGEHEGGSNALVS
jgi:hypothetical protein